MGKVISNTQLNNPEYFLLKVRQDNKTEVGQYYMLRSWDFDPVLSRPISVYDATDEEIHFVYRVIGKGTEKFAKLKAGDEIVCDGPYGQGFPLVENKKALLIGGGVGIAPLYMLAKKLKKLNCKVDIYFSLRNGEILSEELKEVSDNLVLKVNERVVSLPDYSTYDIIYTCGPEPLMEDVYKLSKKVEKPVYASFEKKMGCGFGVCAGCTTKTTEGNKLVCKDGPVFRAEEVFEIG